MSNRQFHLSEVEANELQGAFCICKDGPTRTRLQAVRLYGQSHCVKEVEKVCVCTRSALMTWCRAYRKDGIVALFDKRKGGNHAKLKADQVELIRTLLHTYTPAQLWSAEVCAGEGDFWTVPDLAHLVEERCHVVYQSDNSYRFLFGKCDFTRQRPGYLYKSRSAAAVMAFEEEIEKN
jgi:transposase